MNFETRYALLRHSGLYIEEPYSIRFWFPTFYFFPLHSIIPQLSFPRVEEGKKKEMSLLRRYVTRLAVSPVQSWTPLCGLAYTPFVGRLVEYQTKLKAISATIREVDS